MALHITRSASTLSSSGNTPKYSSLASLWIVFTAVYLALVTAVFLSEEWIIGRANTGFIETKGVQNQCFYLDDFLGCVWTTTTEAFTIISLTSALPLVLLLALVCAIFAGLTVLFTCCVSFAKILAMSGILLLLSGTCLLAVLLCFPVTWGSSVYEDSFCSLRPYNIGSCHMGWGFILAIVTCASGIKAAIFAFILSGRYADAYGAWSPSPDLYDEGGILERVRANQGIEFMTTMWPPRSNTHPLNSTDDDIL